MPEEELESLGVVRVSPDSAGFDGGPKKPPGPNIFCCTGLTVAEGPKMEPNGDEDLQHPMMMLVCITN